MVGQNRQFLHILVDIILETLIGSQQQTRRDEFRIHGEHAIGHPEPQQGEQVVGLNLLYGMDAIDIMGTDEGYPLLLVLRRLFSEAYCQVIPVTEKHRNSDLHILVGTDNPA